MIKICGNSLSKPLEMIFKSCITKREFSSEWKKANVVPVQQKSDEQLQTGLSAANRQKIFGKNDLR